MNKVLKLNFRYFIVLVIVLYITCWNTVIYEDYWSDKLDRAFGKLDYLMPYIRKGLPMDYSDFRYYRPDWSRLLMLDIDQPFQCHGFTIIGFLGYIIVPMIFKFNKHKFMKVYFILDAFFCLQYVYFVYMSIVAFPLYGAIPLIVLSPICLTLMVWFRIRQYKILLNELV